MALGLILAENSKGGCVVIACQQVTQGNDLSGASGLCMPCCTPDFERRGLHVCWGCKDVTHAGGGGVEGPM